MFVLCNYVLMSVKLPCMFKLSGFIRHFGAFGLKNTVWYQARRLNNRSNFTVKDPRENRI